MTHSGQTAPYFAVTHNTVRASQYASPADEFANGTLWNIGSHHSGLMLANLITFAHFSTSAVMKV